MAQSPAHKFGQIIGDALEAAIIPLLMEFARKHNLYLDGKGHRPARKGKKVRWVDRFGNSHDLDHVLERNGTTDRVGVPVAFIETAWRRYTKHSRNKAQEIQGAVLPLVSTHHRSAPFMGAILAGEFTDGALNQLKSLRFKVLYFPYLAVIKAFRVVGLDATFDEETPDDTLAKKVIAWERLKPARRKRVAEKLLEICADEVTTFFKLLEKAVLRKIKAIIVIPLHGTPIECPTIGDAIAKLTVYLEADNRRPVVRYEIEVLYDNDDRIVANFKDRDAAVEFLQGFLPPPIQPAP